MISLLLAPICIFVCLSSTRAFFQPHEPPAFVLPPAGITSASRPPASGRQRASHAEIRLHSASPATEAKESPFENLREVEYRRGAETLPLTPENVETVLDEVRPYLIADGGNVSLKSIEGPDVYLQLEGACGSCPSSVVTVRMGVERRLRERIPEINSVEAVSEGAENGMAFTKENVEKILDGVRPFIKMTGGDITVVEANKVGSVAATVALKMTGRSAENRSIRLEIQQRLRRNFPLLNSVTFV
ncbi:unnamed protein product [Vitrella brassicaformis CCMP3155]|uniref:NIF system FeS cluster assembly NifU C-terminal domain-containing protein n=1 Tax=Vitrella brassicaformis (strain CCMP3155) TaxID=1169540 RepID=A0A0G4GV77_VITBC|nr:unnamed protein product [Vitrella brassicaformis CCMP3155]|eukprot:CEM34747.1 unnamed protein product [Vitrella brassicaformis CCMP3155]